MTLLLAVIKAAPTPEGPAIRDIAGPVDVAPPFWQTVLWLTLAIALLSLATWVIWRCWPRPLPPPPPTPRQNALTELAKLRAQLRDLDPHDFSFEVSAVLRRYIEAQFGLRPTKQTSDEFLADVSRSSRFSVMDGRMLADFLERSDLIKFARQGEEFAASEALLQSATDFVNGGRV